MANTAQPGPWQRFMDTFVHSAINSPLGGEAIARVVLKHQGHSDEAINHAIDATNRDYADKYKNAPIVQTRKGHPLDYVSPDNIGRGVVDLVGSLLGGVDPTYAVGGGATKVARMARQAAVQGGADIVRQGINIKQGHQKDFDTSGPARAAAMGAVFQGGSELLHSVMPKTIPVSKVKEAPIAPDGMPGNRSVRPMDPKDIAHIMGDPDAAGVHGVNDNTMNRRVNNRDIDWKEIHNDDIHDLPPANREFIEQQQAPEAPDPVSTPEGPLTSTGKQYKGFEEHPTDDPDGNKFLTYTASTGDKLPIKMGIEPDGTAEIAIDQFGDKANRLGPKEIRSAMYDLMDMYPEIKRFGGYRRSGAGKGRVQEIEPNRPVAPDNVVEFPQNTATPQYDQMLHEFHNDQLTPAERQEMDASVDKPIVDNTGYEAHTPHIEEPAVPANDKNLPDAAKNFMRDLVQDESGSFGFRPKSKKQKLMDIPDDQLTPEERITKAIQIAEPVRAQRETLVREERSKRFAAAKKQQHVSDGEEGFHQELSKLAGEMPDVSNPYSVRPNLEPDQIRGLFNQVAKHPALSYTDSIHARTGLQKLLATEGPTVPTKSELEVLSKVFPLDPKARKKSISGWISDLINAPRSIMASTDLSAPLRQGLPLIHKKEYWTAFGSMFKQIAPKAFEAVKAEIASRPSYHLMRSSGLALTDIDADLSHHEERFMSDLANKIPIFGHVVKGSERAYVGFLNKLRADTFDSLIKNARASGTKLTDKDVKGIAEFINTATGRGDLNGLIPKFLRGEEFDANKASPLLSGTLFSPRLMASRIQMLNPVYYAKLPPIAQKEAIKSLVATTGFVMTVLGTAHAAGLKVETDPTSTDFAKIRVGHTTFDPTGGFQSYIRLGAQLLMGYKTSPEGKRTSLVSGKFGQPDRLDAIGSFLKNKESPAAALAHELLTQKDRDYNRIDAKHPANIAWDIAKDFAPLAGQDIYDVYDKDGAVTAAAATLPDLFGIGVQTYDPKSKSKSNKKSFNNGFGKSSFGSGFKGGF